MKSLSNRSQLLITLFFCIIAGSIIGYIDTSPNWDDTGITVAATLISSFILGAFFSKYAWLGAIIIGGIIFLFNIIINKNFSAIIVFVLSFAGSYTGMFLKNLQNSIKK